MRRATAVLIGLGLVFTIGLFWNPLGICRRHDYLFRDVRASSTEHQIIIRVEPCGWRVERRSVFTLSSYWGGPYRVLVFVPTAKGDSIEKVRLVSKESGAEVPLVTDPDRPRTGGSGGFFESKKSDFPFQDYRVIFWIGSTEHAFDVTTAYREYWASNLLDAIMSV